MWGRDLSAPTSPARRTDSTPQSSDISQHHWGRAVPKTPGCAGQSRNRFGLAAIPERTPAELRPENLDRLAAA